jgi:hypothetical protein
MDVEEGRESASLDMLFYSYNLSKERVVKLKNLKAPNFTITLEHDLLKKRRQQILDKIKFIKDVAKTGHDWMNDNKTEETVNTLCCSIH